MRFSKKTLYSFLAFFFSIGLIGCGDSTIDPTSVVPTGPKYLLNGVLSNETDANGFSYYINGDEAYVARGTNISTTPEIPDSVTLGGKSYDVTGIYHSGFSKANITNITLPLSITTIDYQAFANSQLASITIPCTVERMGSGAFMNCHSLAAVQFKNDRSSGSGNTGVCGAGGGASGGGSQNEAVIKVIPDYCFFNCNLLSTVSFPLSLTTVESCAFSNCISLTKIAFLDGFTTLKRLALESCTALTDVYFPSSFTSADGYPANCEQGAFYKVNDKCKIHLSTVEENPNNPVVYNTWFNAQTWRYYEENSKPLTVESRLPQDVGLGNDYLYRVENDGTATIFSYAPSAFPVGGIVVMPNVIDGRNVAKAEVTTYASYKTQITQIYLSHNLTTIDAGFFQGMTGLTTISSTGDNCYTPVSNVIDLGAMMSLASIGSSLFTDATYMTDSFAGVVTLPVSLQTIGEAAFKDLKKATKIQFASGVSQLTGVGKQAFMNFGLNRSGDGYGDNSVSSTFDLTLPATCTSIGESAFQNVLGLRKIVFQGASDKSLTINKNAFAYCRSLCQIEFPSENDHVYIEERAFYACSSGAAKSFANISGIEEVFLPASVDKIGPYAFAANERACFFFEDSTNPSPANSNFNQVFNESANGGDGNIQTNTNKNFQFHGIRENNGVYYNVGFDGESSTKKRLIMTDDFCFVETSAAENERGNFICARYRYKPENMNDNEHVTVRVPEYIKFKDSGTHAYDGENSTDSSDFKVISIGDSCFSASFSRNGKALGAVEVPHGIKRIGDNAFMRSIFFNKLTAYSGNSLSNDYTFPSSLRYIGRSAFAFSRLTKALKIPRDVMTFDMIAPAVLKAGTFPATITAIDGVTPRLYTDDEPRRYSSIFANDWLLNEVTFTDDPVVPNAPQTMVYDGAIRGLYRLREIAADGTSAANIQLLMILPWLKNTFTTYFNYPKVNNKRDHEANYVNKQTFNIGGEGHLLKNDTKSIRYGAWRMANWASGITLDSTIKGLFPKKWGNNDDSDTPIPQSLLSGCVDLPTYMNIGAGGNDLDYNIETTSFGITEAEDGFIMPIGVLRNASKVTSMEIPANITEIPAFAFDQAINIQEWITPNANKEPTSGGEDGGEGVLDLRYTSLTTIGTSAFWGLNKTTKVYLPKSLTTLGKDGVDVAQRSCFERWTNKATASALVEVDMSEASNLTGSLPQRCFGSHANLTTVSLPPNITSIENNCFIYCPIETINWPTGNQLTKIMNQAFSGSRVVDLRIPDTVQQLGDKVFENNTALKKLRLPNSLTSQLSANQFTGCTALNQVYFTDMRQSRQNKLTLANGCFQETVKYAMLPMFINDGGNSKPFVNCTDLRAIFYGAKYSEKSNSPTFQSYNGSNDDATVYYYAKDPGDITDLSKNYWRPKEGAPWIAEVVTKSNNQIVPVSPAQEYDFTTDLN